MLTCTFAFTHADFQTHVRDGKRWSAMFSRDKWHLRRQKKKPAGKRTKHFPVKKGLRHRLSVSSSSSSFPSSSPSSSPSSPSSTSEDKKKAKKAKKSKCKYYHYKKSSDNDSPKLFSASFGLDVMVRTYACMHVRMYVRMCEHLYLSLKSLPGTDMHACLYIHAFMRSYIYIRAYIRRSGRGRSRSLSTSLTSAGLAIWRTLDPRV